jgi:hypothetical protein
VAEVNWFADWWQRRYWFVGCWKCFTVSGLLEDMAAVLIVYAWSGGRIVQWWKRLNWFVERWKGLNDKYVQYFVFYIILCF